MKKINNTRLKLIKTFLKQALGTLRKKTMGTAKVTPWIQKPSKRSSKVA